MARLGDFDLNDSSEAASPHANDGGGKSNANRLPAPRTAELPDPESKPIEQLAVCERGIAAAKARWQQANNDAMAAFVDEAGPYLTWVHEHKLHKYLKGPDGKPYGSFERYLRTEHDISRSSGYRITRTIPLLRALKSAENPVADLSVRQTEVLHPLRKQEGAEAVVTVWDLAWGSKKGAVPTPDELSKAIEILDLKLAKSDDPAELPPSAKPGVVDRAEKLLAPAAVREAVQANPERVLLLFQTLQLALKEAGHLPVS
ncbi:hypothetical protein [Kitasatospora sp. NPDC094016]|uniref:hypothetical protein n=1 Tax=Kitasatospora sp. NPDC094016 TaxID=3154986 RepID=UPI00332893FA